MIIRDEIKSRVQHELVECCDTAFDEPGSMTLEETAEAITEAVWLGLPLDPAEHQPGVKGVVDTLRWLAQTVHNAYHGNGHWYDCPKNTCDAVAQVLKLGKHRKA